MSSTATSKTKDHKQKLPFWAAEAKCKDLHDQETVDIRVRVYDEADNMIAKARFTTAYTGQPFEMQ